MIEVGRFDDFILRPELESGKTRNGSKGILSHSPVKAIKKFPLIKASSASERVTGV